MLFCDIRWVLPDRIMYVKMFVKIYGLFQESSDQKEACLYSFEYIFQAKSKYGMSMKIWILNFFEKKRKEKKMSTCHLHSHEAEKKKLFGCPPPLPLIFKNWKKVFTVQKYTAPNFQNSPKSFFFLWEFLSFKNIF